MDPERHDRRGQGHQQGGGRGEGRGSVGGWGRGEGRGRRRARQGDKWSWMKFVPNYWPCPCPWYNYKGGWATSTAKQDAFFVVVMVYCTVQYIKDLQKSF